MIRMKMVWMMQTAQNGSGRPCERWLSEGLVGLESDVICKRRVVMIAALGGAPR
jgi:hypothetical protein